MTGVQTCALPISFHEIYCAPILRIPFLPRIPAAPRRRSPDPLDLGVALGVRLLTVGLSSLGQQNERRGVALPPLPDGPRLGPSLLTGSTAVCAPISACGLNKSHAPFRSHVAAEGRRDTSAVRRRAALPSQFPSPPAEVDLDASSTDREHGNPIPLIIATHAFPIRVQRNHSVD